ATTQPATTGSAETSVVSTSPAEQQPAEGEDEPNAALRNSPAPEPATAKEAVLVIDLREFRKLNEKRAMQAGPTELWYLSQASVAAASAYHQTALAAQRWEEVKKDTDVSSSTEYSDTLFAKDGYYLRLSIGATG